MPSNKENHLTEDFFIPLTKEEAEQISLSKNQQQDNVDDHLSENFFADELKHDELPKNDNVDKLSSGVAGSALGALVGKYRQKQINARLAQEAKLAPRVPVIPPSMVPSMTNPEAGYPTALGEVEGKGTGTYNYGKKFGLTNTEANRAVDMSKNKGGVWDLINKANVANEKIGPGFSVRPERADLLLPTQVGSGARGSRTVPIPIPPVEEVTQPGFLSKIAKYLPTKTLGGALAGFGTGFSAQDAYNRAKEGDYPGAGLSGLTAATSAIAPFVAAPAAATLGGIGSFAAIANELRDPVVRARFLKGFSPSSEASGRMFD